MEISPKPFEKNHLVPMLYAKIHGATVTDADLDYVGSIGIDADLLNRAGLIPNQVVSVYNITNGHRFETYIIEAPASSGEVTINGAAAHLATRGDKVIIVTYHQMPWADALSWEPTVLFVDGENKVISQSEAQANIEDQKDAVDVSTKRSRRLVRVKVAEKPLNKRALPA